MWFLIEQNLLIFTWPGVFYSIYQFWILNFEVKVILPQLLFCYPKPVSSFGHGMKEIHAPCEYLFEVWNYCSAHTVGRSFRLKNTYTFSYHSIRHVFICFSLFFWKVVHCTLFMEKTNLHPGVELSRVWDPMGSKIESSIPITAWYPYSGKISCRTSFLAVDSYMYEVCGAILWRLHPQVINIRVVNLFSCGIFG